ncbi:aldo/keto reductase [Oceanimonas sp. AH20CE76]|uniref:aldo/keto reductase n=1 Tax=Oceanimonas sp. AH20CE76 TaxID=2977120 RepID=UPI0031FEA3FB
MITNASKLALGTVQFGIPYGIANLTGQVESSEVTRILNLAKTESIFTLDTAIAYGESESALGQHDLSEFSVITKLPEVPYGSLDIAEWVNWQLEGSVSRLKVSTLDALLLHRPSQLLESFGDTLYQKLQGLKQQGIVQRIGISIYEPKELDLLCEHFHFDVIQAPFSIIDNRLSDSGWLQRLKGMGTSLHVRSVFMQGLLLMSRQQRPEKFSRWNDLWIKWEQWLEDTGQSALQACLRHALSIPEIEKVVVGVDSAAQFKQVIHASKGSCLSLPAELSMTDSKLLNPSYWNDL